MNVPAALAIAREAHSGQLDKAGEPYVGHPQRVAERVSHLGDRAVLAAVLHDVLEDTDLSAADLLARGVPPAVIHTVQILSRGAGETYDQFIGRIGQCGDPIAVAVKLADIADNLDEDRLGRLPPEEAERLRRKYGAARRKLTAG